MGPWMWGINCAEAARSREQAEIDGGKPHPDACQCDSPSVPLPLYGAQGTLWHYHHECWNCGREILSRTPATYRCRCGVEQTGSASVKACPTYDPDLAEKAAHP